MPRTKKITKSVKVKKESSVESAEFVPQETVVVKETMNFISGVTTLEDVADFYGLEANSVEELAKALNKNFVPGITQLEDLI